MTVTEPDDLFAGGGQMGRLMRTHDWSATPLGPPSGWPQSLRSAVSICLGSAFPIAVYWGEALALLYNDAWSPIPGAKHPWALGRAAREVWPEIWDTIGPLFHRVLTTGEATRSRDQLLPMRRHGYTEECYFDYTFSPIRGEHERVAGVFNAVIETTERVVGERRLRTLSELGAHGRGARDALEVCRRTADTLSRNPADVPFALIYLTDPETCTARLAASTGLGAEEPLAQPTILLDPSADPAAWPLAGVAETHVAAVVESLGLQNETAAAGPWPEPPDSAVVLPIVAAGQALPVGFLIAGVSPRRPLDPSYHSFFSLAAGHLASALADARAYEDERRRTEALAEIDRAKTVFFSNVSHEFRTPLTLQLGPLEDALGDTGEPLPARQRERIAIAHRNAVRLLKLVNSLLDFARVEAGRLDATFEPTDLSVLTADLASTFRAAMERAGLRLVVDCPPGAASAYVDRDLWEKIVLNLLSNALKFTLEGTVRVAVEPGPDSVRLIVADTGVGIPADELPRLFERFHRVRGSAGRTHEGTGIGLALVAELVRLHGGTIDAASEPGRGTTFTVTVPTGHAHLPAALVRTAPATAALASPGAASPYVAEALRWLPEPAQAPGGAERRLGPRGQDALAPDQGEALDDLRGDPGPRPAEVAGGATILVADDNADMRDYVSRLLDRRWTVRTAANGEEALAMIRQHPPDLLISDVMMPRLDGFELVTALRGDPATRSLPIILLSARAGEESRIEGLEAGADDYLVKPFPARELVARVEGALALQQLRRTQETRLRQAAKMEAIGRLAGGIAHDFNNQLQGISGFAGFVARDPALGPRARSDLAEIQKASERLAGLTRQLLAFSRQQVLTPETLELNEAVRDAQPLLQRLIGAQVQTVLDLAGEPLWIRVDRAQLLQVLLNLSINARDAMPSGGTLRLATTTREIEAPAMAGVGAEPLEPGRYAVLTVTDTGMGIAPEHLPHIFEPFFTTKAVGEGTGLGLATVHGIVAQSHGAVWAGPGAGGGTVFTVLLPAAAPPAAEPASGGGSEPADTRRQRVLVVDDEDIVRATLGRLLALEGYEVLEARNGHEALQHLAREGAAVDLVLSDVVMPGLGGRAFASRLAAEHPAVPLVWMSGYPRDSAFFGGADGDGGPPDDRPFLQKPIAPAVLAETVRELLAEAQPAPGR